MNALCKHDDKVWCIWCIEDGQHLPAGSVIEASCKKRQPALCAFEVCSCLQEQRLIPRGIKDVPKEDSIYLYDQNCGCARCRKRRERIQAAKDNAQFARLLSSVLFVPRRKKKSLLQRLKGFLK